MSELDFEQWMSIVDELLIATVGRVSGDLDDCLYHDWFDEGIEPQKAVTLVLICNKRILVL